MKKIINRRAYDTDTATEIGYWENMPDIRNFQHESETLYRKKNGEYFLHGEGGPASRYAEPAGANTWTGGARIMPLTYEEAEKWAEEHLEADEYEREFGEVSEDETESVVISVRVTPAAKAALDRMAAKTGRSKGGLVSDAILALE
jgi:hypothetical protein